MDDLSRLTWSTCSTWQSSPSFRCSSLSFVFMRQELLLLVFWLMWLTHRRAVVYNVQRSYSMFVACLHTRSPIQSSTLKFFSAFFLNAARWAETIFLPLLHILGCQHFVPKPNKACKFTREVAGSTEDWAMLSRGDNIHHNNPSSLCRCLTSIIDSIFTLLGKALRFKLNNGKHSNSEKVHCRDVTRIDDKGQTGTQERERESRKF